MPATARRPKSEAYEKGIREGKAMAARSRGAEPPEEAEEDELEMDMEPGHSRKRSAKGAKHTKPAADGYGMKKPMDAECGCSGKKGGKCDGNCGSMRKRSDSLTPLEYLDAIELGIQDCSTAYIRARLDTAKARNDLKCGKGAISEGEKCTKGAAQKVAPAQPSRGRSGGSKVRGLKTAAKLAGAAALIGGAAYMQQTARRNIIQRGATSGPGTRSNTMFLGDLRKMGATNETARRMRERAAVQSSAKKRSSIRDPWADGFSSDAGTYDI